MKFYITTPIYYVNAQPHIGHAYTTLAADVIARWKKLQGHEVFFLTGTDEHGAKVSQAAYEKGKSPQEFSDTIAGQFKNAWKRLGIDYSDFIRTTEPRHEKGVQEFLQLLKYQNALYEGEYKGLYCTGCENFVTESEAINGNCPIHKKPLESVAEKNWFFKLSEHIDEIRKRIERDEILIQPSFAKKEALGLLKQGLGDFSISRQHVQWGVPLPWDASQTVYVWVDALLNYITARGYPDIERKWPADLQLIGKDILKFHAIYWPAMLLAAGLETQKELFVHGFFTIDGEKMSKSLGNVIDPNELIATYGVDGARYLILSQFPFGQDGDIKAELFREQYNAALANGLGNLVSRVTAVVLKNSAIALIPKEYAPIANVWQAIEKHYEARALEEVLKESDRLITEADGIVESEKIWELGAADKKKAGEVFYRLLETIRHIAWIIRPFLPETSDKIFHALGIPNEGKKSYTEAIRWGGLPVDTTIKKPLLFKKTIIIRT